MNLSSLTFWSNFLGWSAVSLTGLAALTGILAWHFTVQLNSAKDEADAKFRTESSTNIAAADARAAEANTKAESFRLAIAAADERAANANRIAEGERLARVKIEEGLASRRIHEEERSKLATRLSSFSGQTVNLWFNAGDHEAFVFASDLAAALESAHWNVYAPATLIHMLGSGRRGPTNVESGVVVLSTSDDPSIKASEAIVRELLAIGFDAHKSPKIETRTVPVVIVNIEVRPEGAQGDAKLKKSHFPSMGSSFKPNAYPDSKPAKP